MAASTREVYLLLRARDEASRIIRGFSAELSRSAAAMQAAALRAEATTQRQTAAAMRAAGATRSQVAAVLANAKALDAQAKSLEDNEKRQKRFAESLRAVSGGLETLGIGFMIAGGVATHFFIESAQMWADYERQAALTRTQIDGFSASLKEVADIGMDIARRIPVAFEQIQPALFDIFSSTNANLEQATILLEAFSKAAVAGQTDIQTAARGTISIMNAYNVPFEDVNKILDIQFELVRKGVGSYEEFANVFGRVVPSATRAGQSFETIAAMLAFMTRNGQSAAMASSSAARALEAMSHPKTVEKLEKMGVAARDAQGNFRPLVDVMTELRDKIMKLPPADRVAALFELLKGSGGTIQARRFIEQILLREGDLENFRDLMLSMSNASGVMEDKFGEMADTAASKMQLLSNRWTVLRMAIGEAAAPVLLVVVDYLSRLVEWFNNLDPATKRIITQFAIWGSLLAIVGGAILTVVGFMAAFVAAFVMAGAEILVVIGIVTALGAALVSTAGTIYALWQNSESFRNSLKSLKDTIMDFWKNAAEPAFIAVAGFMESRVIPAVKEVVSFFGTALSKAIDVLGDGFRNVLLPLLQAAVKWYNENKESVDRALGVLVTLGKWILKLGAIISAVLVVLLGGPVIAILAAVIASIWATVAAFTAIVDAIVAIGKWFGDNWSSIWEGIANFFKDIWNAISGFFVERWNALVEGITTGLNFLRSLWEGFWSVFGGVIKAAWDLVLAIVELSWAIITKIIEIGLYVLQAVWNTIWGAITETAKAVWTEIVNFFTAIWNGLVATWEAIWSVIGDKVKEIWNSIKTFLTNAWNEITDLAADAWQYWYTIISNKVKEAWHSILNAINNVKNFFAGAGSWLLDAGKNIIQGLMDGIESKLEALKNKVKNAAKMVRDFWPFSPAKTGPLSGRGDLMIAGQEITNRIAEGMAKNSDTLAMASAQLTRRINVDGAGNFQSAGASAFAPVEAVGVQEPASKIVNMPITINTQEIDPKRNAAELGFLIDGRL